MLHDDRNHDISENGSIAYANDTVDAPKHPPLFGACWPILIELWLAFVLISFFIVRVLGSNLGQRIISRLHG